MSRRDNFDVIVIGAGHNGLVCAYYLAEAGFSVVVLERSDRTGGAAITEEFHPGFRNSVASYTVSLLQQTIINEMKLARHGLRIVPRPLANFAPQIDAPGLKLHQEVAASVAAIGAPCVGRHPALGGRLQDGRRRRWPRAGRADHRRGIHRPGGRGTRLFL